MEKEYRILKYRNKVETFQITLCFCVLLLLSFAVSAVARDDIAIGSVFFGIIGILILMLCFKQKLQKFNRFLIIVVTFLLSMSSLAYAFLRINTGSPSLQLLRGWSFASFQIILVNTFPKLRDKILFILVVFVVRYTVTGILHSDIFDPDVLIRNILSDAFVIYIYFSFEKKERAIFQDFYEYREELVKFKDLLDNYLPQSITILDTKIQSLFSNKAFLNLFPQCSIQESLNTTTNQQTQPQFQQTVSPLQLFKIQKNSIRQVDDPSFTLPDFGPDTSLQLLVQDLLEQQFYGQKAFSLSASSVNHGNTKSFELILIPIIWDKHDAIALILNDITYQENLIALKLADENKDRLIATVSHELRTPLNGIIGILQIVESQVNQPEVTENLSLIKDNANLLLSLVNSLLDLHQINNGKLQLNISKFEVIKVLKDTLRLFQFQAKQKKIYLDYKIGEDMPNCIETDENRLKQILINLVGNAIKFTSKGGITVEVTSDPEDSRNIKILVADTGIGIKEEHKNRLFKMYGKLEDGENLNTNGVGLGLTISNSLAKVLGCNNNTNGIQMQSIYGVGSRFWFCISKNLDTMSTIGSQERFERRVIIEDNQKTKGLQRVLQSNSKQNPQQELNISIDDDIDELKVSSSFEVRINDHTLQDLRGFESINSRRALKSPTEEPPGSEEVIKPKKLSDSLHKTRIYQKFKSNFNRFNPDVIKENQQAKGCVLIVDDNAFNIMVVKSLIEDLGYLTETVMSGQEAIDKVKEMANQGRKILLILMDCQMPLMDGFETTVILSEMMDRMEVERTPIFALTANNSEEDVKKCFKSGMVGYLSKPILKEKLQETLTQL